MKLKVTGREGYDGYPLSFVVNEIVDVGNHKRPYNTATKIIINKYPTLSSFDKTDGYYCYFRVNKVKEN